MKTIAHFTAWHIAFGTRPVRMAKGENTLLGCIRILDRMIETTKSINPKEYILRWPAVQLRLLGAKWLRWQYRQMLTK